MASAAERPNILWICTDQQRYDTIGALGNPYVHTPNINRLAAEGVAFTYAFCQSPICTPSRASFLTGMYPSSVHGCVNGNETWAGAAPLISKLLADVGYDTGLVGKLHLAGAQGRVEPRGDDGYRLFYWSHAPRDDWPTGHAYADWLREQGADPARLLAKPEEVPVALHQTTWCAQKAAEMIEKDLEPPWFISVNPFDPHPVGHRFAPPRELLWRYDPMAMPGPLFRESDLTAQTRLQDVDFQTQVRRPDEFDAKAIQARYYAMIELIDWAVGQILTSLERSGQRENTLIIFTSDHGEMLGDHGLLLKGCRFYEGLVRVPLIVSWPGRFSTGLVSEALVELTDLAPTLLEAIGLEGHHRMQGCSLIPILSGTAAPHEHREFVRCEYYHALNPSVPEREGRFNGSYATMIRTRQHKLVVYHGYLLGELFDLQRDPGEFDNLWESPQHAGLRFDLIKRSFDALALAVDLGPPQVTYY